MTKPTGFADIHTHILPGIDDGSKDWSESLAMASIAAEDGTDLLVCTPHTNIPGYCKNYDGPYLQRLFAELGELLIQEHIPLQIARGAEVYAAMDMQDFIDEGLILPLNGTDHYLVEFDFAVRPEEIEEILNGMRRFGLRPVLAHPERYDCVKQDPQLVFGWAADGILIQCNRGSLFGAFGRQAERTVRRLLDHNLVTCIASDAHGCRMRTPRLSDVYEVLRDDYSEELAVRLTSVNPRAILRGERIMPRGLIPFEERRFY